MKHLKRIHLFNIVVTVASLSIAHVTTAFAEDPESICRRLPATPEPQVTSTLRLFTAYAMPTIIAQFGTTALETDHIYTKTLSNNQTETLRNVTRAAQPYHWEISLFWNISKLPNDRNLTPLTEAYRHHEYRLREAYKICNALRHNPFGYRHQHEISSINPATSLDYLLSTIEQQRATALLEIYLPQTIIYPRINTPNPTIATGVLP